MLPILSQDQTKSLGAGMLHHLEIYVSNLEHSRVFWGWLLEWMGYTRHQEWSKGVSFKYGDTYLVFVQVEEPYRNVPFHRKRVGLNHLALRAPSRQAVDELASELRQRGVKVLYNSPVTDGDHYAVFFEDPDRIKVEFVSEDPKYSET